VAVQPIDETCAALNRITQPPDPGVLHRFFVGRDRGMSPMSAGDVAALGDRQVLGLPAPPDFAIAGRLYAARRARRPSGVPAARRLPADVDFPNPVFSERRASLLAHAPDVPDAQFAQATADAILAAADGTPPGSPSASSLACGQWATPGGPTSTGAWRRTTTRSPAPGDAGGCRRLHAPGRVAARARAGAADRREPAAVRDDEHRARAACDAPRRNGGHAVSRLAQFSAPAELSELPGDGRQPAESRDERWRPRPSHAADEQPLRGDLAPRGRHDPAPGGQRHARDEPAAARHLRRPRRPEPQQRPADRRRGQRPRRAGSSDHDRRSPRPLHRGPRDRRYGGARRRQPSRLLDDRARNARAGPAASYEVPAELGFTVGDITVGGRPIEFGAQLADNVQIKVTAIAARPGSFSPQRYDCVPPWFSASAMRAARLAPNQRPAAS